MKPNKLLLIILLHLGLIIQALPQTSGEVKFDHLTIEQGLSQSIVNSIAQDKYGFVWIGTEDGLNKYDGLSVQVYHATADSFSIAGDWITAIYLDSDKQLWFCTKNGLSVYNDDTENFISFRHQVSDSSSISSNSLLSICEYEGDLWVGTSDAGISRYNKQTKKFTHYQHDDANSKGLPGNRINALLVDHSNTLWIGTNQGLAKYNATKDNFVSYREGQSYRYLLPSDDIRSLYQSGDNVLWVGTGEGGMSRFNKRKTRIINYMKQENIHEMMRKAGINVIKEDSKGNFWVGTSQGILRKARGVSERDFSVIKHSASEPKSLTNNDISTIFEDSSGLIWIGTKGGGINIYNSRQKRFDHYNHDYRNPNSLSKNVVQAIYEGSKSALWIGLREGGLNKFDRNKGEFTRFADYPNKRDSLWAKTVTSIFIDHRNILWVGSANQGLNRWVLKKDKRKRWRRRRNRKTGPERIWEHFTPNANKTNGISSTQIRHIFEDPDHNLWIATANGLNMLVDADSSKFISYVHDPQNPTSISDNDIASQAAIYGNDGVIWLGTAKGVLNQFDKFTEHFKHYRHDPTKPKHSIPNKPILALCEQDSVIWIGTNGGGLARFHKQTHRVKVYTKDHGLSNNVVYGIQVDKKGKLWVSTKRGLCNFNPLTEKFQNYYAYHGLQSNVFSEGAAHKGQFSGDMFFGGINGLTTFKAQDIKENSYIPPVYITKFSINNEDVAIVSNPPKGQAYHLSKSILNTKQINLTYEDKYISFRFVALNYSNPSKNKYKYKLEPFDKQWIEATSANPEASYTNLPAGNYTFMVMGANNDGIWNETPTTIQIRMVPPWWEKTPYRILGIILALALIYSIYRFRVRMLKRQQRKLQHKINIRTAEVKERNEQLHLQQKKILKQNKDIQDSIQYAQRIQTAIMPSKKTLSKLLKEHFILFRPRNIVSGDFYWATEKYGKTIVAVVDCTGHGVPGAFMSVIGASLLKEIVDSRGITDPAIILTKMNQGVQHALQQEEYKTRDGMDIGIVVLDKLPDETTKLTFAGAHNPLMYIQNDVLHQVKASRQAVGGYGTKLQPYEKHTLIIDQPTMVYMASDGFQDQFGGPKDKKIMKKNFKKILHAIHELPLHEQRQYLENHFDNWKGQGSQTDDVLVFGFKLGHN